MTASSESVLTFAVAGIFGAGRLASRLKELESVDLIGPWHVGRWIDYTHTAIRIRFSSQADARTALINVGFAPGLPDGSAQSQTDDDGSQMLAQFNWRDLLAASVIATGIAAIALCMSALPTLFHFAHGPASHRLADPRHNPAAFNPPSNSLDPLHDEKETGDGTRASSDNRSLENSGVPETPARNATVQRIGTRP